MNSTNVYGAFVRVWIRYDGTLEQLANTLASKLQLNSFDVEPSADSPHVKVGMTEAFGWEAWLEEDAKYPPCNFILKMETEDTFAEIAQGKMHDLSPWFARFLSNSFDIEAFLAEEILPE
ncbi:hypothetical protein [Schlesneria paludicola]|uniref:hypothetical protein n=1 Tax=Schlesneria paludicola TaxID=360056 RepID=UPI0012F7CCA4|nr:hypothetical protein [Schlesneria paludicola]